MEDFLGVIDGLLARIKVVGNMLVAERSETCSLLPFIRQKNRDIPSRNALISEINFSSHDPRVRLGLDSHDRFRAWKHFLKVPTEASSNKVYEINPALTERLMIVIGC